MARTTILPTDRDLSDEELAAEGPVVRQILVLGLQDVLRDARVQGELSAQFSERGPDPRWAEIQIRAALAIARLMGLDRVVPGARQPQSEDSAGAVVVDERVLRERVLGLLQVAGS